MVSKRFLVIIGILVFMAASSFANDSLKALTMVRYVQNWDDFEGSISLKNNTKENIFNVRFEIDYFDMDGKAIDYKVYSKDVDIAPNMTRQIDIPAFEHRRKYSYYKSERLGDYPMFKITFKLLAYNEKRKDVEYIDTVSYSSRTPSDDRVFDVVEQMPTFPGGPAAMMKYIDENLKYPVVAHENGIQGRVVVSFIVEADGSISNVNVVRPVDSSLDREAMRVVRSMPKWIPGKSNGRSVRVKYNVPVSFRID